LDCMAAACFRDFTSWSSSASARSTASPIPEAFPTSGGTSQRRPAHQMGTQRYRIDYSRVRATHLHPLLGLADRLQMPSHRCRVHQVVRQQLDPATTTGGGFGADRMGSESWISGERTTTSRAGRAGSGSVAASSPPVVAAAPSAATSISSGAPPVAS
jgi:hypothetical protein